MILEMLLLRIRGFGVLETTCDAKCRINEPTITALLIIINGINYLLPDLSAFSASLTK